MKSDDYEDLMVQMGSIRKEHRRRLGTQYPFMNCIDSAKLLAREQGLVYIRGEYCGPMHQHFIERASTWWNIEDYFPSQLGHDFCYDHQHRVFIDFTASQFHANLPEILIMKPEDQRLGLYCQHDKCTHIVRHSYFIENSCKREVRIQKDGTLLT